MRNKWFTPLPFLALSATATLALASGCGSDASSGGDSNEVFGGNSQGGNSSAGSSSGGSSSGGSNSSFGGNDSMGGNFIATGGTASGGSGTIDPDAGCAAESQTGKRIPANLLFVIDKSGSMQCNPPPTTQSAACESSPIKDNPALNSKWEDTRTALEAALDSVAAQSDVRVGVSVFPRGNQPAEACTVVESPDIPVELLDATHLDAIKQFFGSVNPYGQTPLAGATILSYKYFLDQIKTGGLTGNNFVVLITDGAETCATGELTKLVAQDVPNARKLNIRTFVIGAPGSEPARSLLSKIAVAGGTERSGGTPSNPIPCNADHGDCHFDLTNVTTPEDFADQLAQALDDISGSVLTCEFDIPKNPSGNAVDLNKVNVTVTEDDGTKHELTKDTANCDTQADGWQYNADNTKIILCGNACETAQKENSSVNIVLGCPSILK